MNWRRLLIVGLSVVCLHPALTGDAAADWQYTRWGMTKAQVSDASQGLAVVHEVSKRESWGIYPDLVAPLLNLADLLRTIGQDDEAAELEDQAEAIRTVHIGEPIRH